MSTEYYATFSAVPLTRDELVDSLSGLLFEMRAELDLDSYRLKLEHGRLHFTYESAESVSLAHALKNTAEWDGVELNFTFLDQMCSLMIWNDIPHHTTVVLCEPGSLFEEQLADRTYRKAWVALLVRWCTVLGASFCVFEAECVFRSRTQDDIMKWLNDVSHGKERDWRLLIVTNSTISSEKVTMDVKTKYHFHIASSDFWVLSNMGDLDDDESLEEW